MPRHRTPIVYMYLGDGMASEFWTTSLSFIQVGRRWIDLKSIDTGTWTQPETTGSPPRRMGHTMTLVNRRLFVFGGADGGPGSPDIVFMNDLHVLNLGMLPAPILSNSDQIRLPGV